MPVPALGSTAAGLWVLGTLDVRMGKQLLAQNLNSQLSLVHAATFYSQNNT